MIYQTFAKLYDDLFDSDLYDDWLTYATTEIEQPKQPLLELACGAGRLAVMLASAGVPVTGFDLSEEMLSLADQHAQEAGVSLPLIQGDMRDLTGLSRFQTVTCFADSLCYLTDEAALQTVFEQVYQHLNDGGQFLFDVISPYQTDEVYPGYMYNYQDENQAFLWESSSDTMPHSVIHDLTFFTYNQQKEAFDRVVETHHERTYPVETYLRRLKQSGFEDVSVTAEFGTQVVQKTTTRWFFSCRKRR
ncbi:class I SAM-dependent DNA methyltransferase [Secundilactobacillus kimchicus]|uniref:class I SAM-dependent DNA methyltransferase n=1 Tax=Secundilactobacillus kimchicus TaxID=528209 RepID=UPI0024A8BEBC|nr:class I SAM-dependent methyltransferase [Secundilactobacillus kimchicus]